MNTTVDFNTQTPVKIDIQVPPGHVVVSEKWHGTDLARSLQRTWFHFTIITVYHLIKFNYTNYRPYAVGFNEKTLAAADVHMNAG